MVIMESFLAPIEDPEQNENPFSDTDPSVEPAVETNIFRATGGPPEPVWEDYDDGNGLFNSGKKLKQSHGRHGRGKSNTVRREKKIIDD